MKVLREATYNEVRKAFGITNECAVSFRDYTRGGETLRGGYVVMEDGTIDGTFTSDKRPGYFKQVFVPHEFEHPEILKF